MDAPPDYRVEPGPLRLLDTRVMHGANYFSGGPVAVFRVDLGEYDEVFSDHIPGFAEALEKTVPSLIEHKCSIGEVGGFLLRVREGTLLGHITEHVAIELQTLAGMDVAYGKTRSTSDPGVYNVVFRFFDEMAGIYAGWAALNLVNSLLAGSAFDVAPVVQRLIEIREERLLGPSTQALVDEAAARNIPALRLDDYNLVQLGTGCYQRRIRATITSDTSSIAVENVDNKRLTNQMLDEAGVPVAPTRCVDTLEQALTWGRNHAQGLVIKPLQGHLGQGISIGVATAEEIEDAMHWARHAPWGSSDDPVLVQAKIPGNTYRFLVIDFKVAAAARLEAAWIRGDGVSTADQLVAGLNEDSRRGYGDKNLLSMVRITEVTERILSQHDLSMDSVVPNELLVPLQISGNLRLGGSATDVTDAIHPMLRFVVERAARVVNLNVAGIDVVTSDPSQPPVENGGAIIDINAAPDLRPHLQPADGLQRNVAKPIIDLLFPLGDKARIPVFSVTGTVGKTTAAFLIAHCLRHTGMHPGLTTTEGLYVAGTRLMKGDMTYPEQVALVLRDPTIDAAVLETSREGILRRGLGYETADVGIILNMHDDHVGADDIMRLDDLAYAKSVVAEQVPEEGVVVLNAENELVAEMADRVWAELIYFARQRKHPRIVEHTNAGGRAVVVDGRYIAALEGRSKTELLHLEDIPLLHQGRALCNLDAVLATAAALWGHGLAIDDIRRGISGFAPLPETLPGRLNLMKTGAFDVLVDYAHNRVGLDGLGQFLDHFGCRKIAVLDAPGDRSDDAIRDLARLAATIFDEIVVYEDPDRRGRDQGEIRYLLASTLREEGFPEESLESCESMEGAFRRGLDRADPSSMVVILTGRSQEAIAAVREFSTNHS